MKSLIGMRFNLMLIAGLVCLPISAQVLEKKEAQKIVAQSEMVQLDSLSQTIEQIRFAQGHKVAKDQPAVNRYLRGILSTKTGFDFKAEPAKPDQFGFTRVKTLQTFKGIPIYGAVFHLHYKGLELRHANGQYVNADMPSEKPSLNYDDALKLALYRVNAKEYVWQVDENYKKSEVGKLTYLPMDNNEVRLTYQFDVFATVPMSRQYIFVDAHTGEIVKTINRIHHNDEVGQAMTYYSGQKPITTSKKGLNYVLQQTGRCGIETYNLKQSMSYSSAVDFTDADNNWTSTLNFDNAAYDAHYGTEKTYDFFKTKYNRNSFDDKGSKLISYVHYGNGYSNAFWNGSFMTYGDGDGVSRFPLTCIDIIAHEISHGVTEYSAGLEYSYESGALNESFSDIFGICVDFYANPSTANWLMAEQTSSTNTPIRSMANPNDQLQPDTYGGLYWYTGSSDYGGVHTNSGVQNYWFYLLVNGGSGTNDIGNVYSITGIGMDKAAQIAYRTLTTYLTPQSNYAAARTYSIQAAVDIYGDCSAEVAAVTNAWYAVGVGTGYFNGVTANFSASQLYNCTAPAAIQFNYQGFNGTTFLWEFGDGATSTLKNPQHTYNSAGVYSVQLSAQGSSTCNTSDVVSKPNYIQVASGGPIASVCIPSRSSSPFVAIEGFSLGTISNATSSISTAYIDNSCSQMTYLDEGERYRIAVNCSRSYNSSVAVWIDFDNNGSFDPSTELVFSSLNKYGMHTDSIIMPQGSVYGVALRMRVGADYYGNTVFPCYTNYGQFEDFSVILNQNTDKPLADIATSSNTIGTQGTVQFTDKSLRLPTSWKWVFEGGTPATSSLQNPTVTYSTVGDYDVVLVATNANGADTIVKENLISVVDEYVMCQQTSSTSTSGILFDPGKNDVYTNGANCTFLINPGCVDSISLSFSSFSLESFDYLTIYDGDNVGAKELGRFTGSSLPRTVVARSGKMLLKFTSDNSVTYQGFVASWTSTVLTNKDTPVAAFESSNDNPMLGQSVLFTDTSTKIVSQWQWFVNELPFSTVQNPSYVFAASGTHQIKLIAKNCFSADTVVNSLQVQGAPALTLSVDSIKSALLTDEVDTLAFGVGNLLGNGDMMVALSQKNLGRPASVTIDRNSNLLGDTINKPLLLDLSGYKIAIACGSLHLSLKNELAARGATLITLTSSNFSSDLLASCDLLVVDAQLEYFTTAQVNLMSSWIQNGGNALLLENNNYANYYFNLLMTGSGVTINNMGYYYSGLLSDIKQHQITTAITGILSYNFYQKFTTNSTSVVLVNDTYGSPALIATPLGKGRFVASCHSLFGNSELSSSNQNRTLANQAIDWLIEQSSNKWFSIVGEKDFVVDAGKSTDVSVRFDAKNLLGGLYTGQITVKSNDPAIQSVVLPVQLNVTGVPKIVVKDTVVAFGDLFVGSTLTKSIVIDNTGTDTLKITNLTFSDSQFSSSLTKLNIPARQSAVLPINFSPVNASSFDAKVTISNNDKKAGNLVVKLRGRSLIAPKMTVRPDSIKHTLYNGERDSVDLVISNLLGGSVLEYNLSTGLHQLKDTTSTKYYTSYGQTTEHNFYGISSVLDSITLVVTLNGDYTNSTSEYAKLVIEGVDLGVINTVDTPDGTDFVRTYKLGGANVKQWLSNSKLDVLIVNSSGVDVGYGKSLNSVRLTTKANGWCNVPNPKGSVNVDANQTVKVHLNAIGLLGGVYKTSVFVRSNDPVNTIDTVAVVLTVIGTPVISANPQSVSFGNVYVGNDMGRPVVIENKGSDNLVISNITFTNSSFMVDKNVMTILPGKSQTITVTFNPSSAVNYLDKMVIECNDLKNPRFEVGLIGRGIHPSKVGLNPLYYYITMAKGEVTSRTLTINNSGLGDLSYLFRTTTGNFDSTSVQTYTTSGATTTHRFVGLPTSLDSLSLLITLNGDYGDYGENASLVVDGTNKGVINTTNFPDGTDYSRRYTFSGSELLNWLSDGQILVQIVNNYSVDYGYGKSLHKAKLVVDVPQNWCFPINKSGSVAPNSNIQTEVIFDAINLKVGVHETNLQFSTNDPSNPMAVVPVVVNVVKGNSSPVVQKALSNLAMTVNEKPRTVYLNGVFSDADGDVLYYSIDNANISCASVSLSSNQLTVTPLAVGEAKVTVYAFDNKGGQVSNEFTVVVGPVATGIGHGVTDDAGLGAYNEPNPFNQKTTIHFTLNKPGKVKVGIYTIDGLLVETLWDGILMQGANKVEFNGGGLTPSVYLYRIETEDGSTSYKKMIKK
jgi:Zn-dependent metalloprotease